MKLNLGCGTNKISGWENYDADVDIGKRLPFADHSAEFIFIEHCVEHIDYYAAIEFFKECRRVLKPKGVLRVVVPSIEMIRNCGDDDYYKLAAKWGATPDVRGAMHAILYSHGHKTAWTASLMEATLKFAGFDNVKQCKVHESEHAELCGVEGHHRVIGEKFNVIESLIFEGEANAAQLGVIASSAHRVAIIVGGAETVDKEVEEAKALCRQVGIEPIFLVINDKISLFPGECWAVSLHPDKLLGWLDQRRRNGHPVPQQIWSHRATRSVSHNTKDWGGSSGLFATKIARENGMLVLLCGVPMTVEAQHFLRHVRWVACHAFRRAWERHRAELAPYVRSFSGWTEELFGRPDEAFLGKVKQLEAAE